MYYINFRHLCACKIILILSTLLIFQISIFSQSTIDSNLIETIEEVTVKGSPNRNVVKPIKGIEHSFIYDGKKNESIYLSKSDVNVSEKCARQVFAKVPGIFVYDMDGAGNQVNISARGLDPHRGWEFNIRKDGIITNSDMYGYPASHYSMPMESIDKINIVRGTASLQYGAQFGGMVNYLTKQADTSKVFHLENYTTLGSFNLKSNFFSIGGRMNNLKYYGYYYVKSRDGYRNGEHTDANAASFSLEYSIHPRLQIKAEWSHSAYTYKMAGPLTDAQFLENPRQASRNRNYFNPDIHIPSLSLWWKINDQSHISYVLSALLGNRNSVLYDRSATIKDSINAVTGKYNPRQVDIDQFNSLTQEMRFQHEYAMFNKRSTIVAGIQWMDNDLRRRQLGVGSNGTDFDLTVQNDQWVRDMYFRSKNWAVFFEHQWQLSQRMKFNIGSRVESGQSELSGKISYLENGVVPTVIKHQYPLFGASASYQFNKYLECYGGISQSYRPVLFKDIIPSTIYDRIDNNIKDGKGYNAEIGMRRYTSTKLKFDITFFALRVNNKPGSIAINDPAYGVLTYRTNIGNALTKGIEAFVQWQHAITSSCNIAIFTATSLMDGRYIFGSIKSANLNVDITNRKIESVPALISRNGFTFIYRKLSTTLLYSHTSKSYADALNTEHPSANGAVGIVPDYQLMDINATYVFNKHIEIKGSINNVGNVQYFTKRPLIYPGPGVWPSDGRSFNCSVIFRM